MSPPRASSFQPNRRKADRACPLDDRAQEIGAAGGQQLVVKCSIGGIKETTAGVSPGLLRLHPQIGPQSSLGAPDRGRSDGRIGTAPQGGLASRKIGRPGGFGQHRSSLPFSTPSGATTGLQRWHGIFLGCFGQGGSLQGSRERRRQAPWQQAFVLALTSLPAWAWEIRALRASAISRSDALGMPRTALSWSGDRMRARKSGSFAARSMRSTRSFMSVLRRGFEHPNGRHVGLSAHTPATFRPFASKKPLSTNL